jgi:hypothetical protein
VGLLTYSFIYPIPRYVVKTVCHLALGIYMWNSNRLRDRNAVAAGENISKAERARLAEEEGMVCTLFYAVRHLDKIISAERHYGVR